MPVSQNGYPVLDAHETRPWVIPGAGRSLRLAPTSPGWLLAHFATWFHENIESLFGPQLDDWGYALRPIRGQTTGWSNHSSGTAIDLNATSHPLGARGTFNERQERMLVQRLAGHYGETIRWGGSYSGRADEMHFEINRPYAVVVATANRLRDSRVGRRVSLAND